MKKILLYTIFILSPLIFSQEVELDEAYLQSLPEDVRQDVLDEITLREESDKTLYRRPSSMILKPEDEEQEEESDRFGDKIFNMMQSSFMPINEPNFDSSYVLDFGDTLEVQLIGQKNSIDELPIKRDGSINVPEIGKISVAGLSLENATSLIKNKINNGFIGVEIFVTLTDVRDIQVLITGDAYNPGIYTLNGNSNLLHALSMAGGINENGSYRNIDVIRNNEVIESVDLYDTFIHGKSGFGQRLRSGDSIVIRPSRGTVNISGAVKRPGSYELNPDENFLDLFNYGNGFSTIADKDSVRIEKIIKDETKYIEIDNIESLAEFMPNSGDRLNIGSYIRKFVKISGAVKTPGTYVISKDETLSSLIQKAEGYTDDAYPFGGVLINKRAEEINQEAIERLYKAYVNRLISSGDTLFASESLPFVLEELKDSTVSGRVIAEFDLDVIAISPEKDTSLEDGDEIIIPIKSQQVYIFGEVNNAGATRYKPGSNINDYIIQSGGRLQTADDRNIFVVHPNGEVNKINQNTRLSTLSRNNEILIYPGSVIYVPRNIVKDATTVASIWAPLISSMATSITAISVLNNNR